MGEYTANNSNIISKEYVYLGDTPIAVVQAGNILTVQTDHLDTPRQLTDNTKKIVWNWAYSAFGENQPTTTNNTVFNLRYPGQYYDAESKLHYNINRYYDPATGRYTQSDPIGLSGGINTYTYVGGNTVRWSDPYGLWDTGDLPQFPQGGVDFSAGFGDSISFGATSAIRSGLGTDSLVDKNSGAYTGGEVAGAALSLMSGVAGGVKAAGTKGVGKEFSHWIPARTFRTSSNSYNSTINTVYGRVKNIILNGNYVTPKRHYLHDSFRYPRGWRDFGNRFPVVLQQVDRIPNIFKGAGVGLIYGIAGMSINGDYSCK